VRPRGAHLHQESAVLDGLRAFGRRCAYREEHAEQVAHLSLSLFDQLPDLHRLGEEERALLHATTSTATTSCTMPICPAIPIASGS
jgi:exopolyphosphatase/pppGpp-phosphohydrolase